ncbi:MAG TPA: sigma-70 family RNA polymerase sigma factor, partial [Myxococcales bacterium]|nr:sigma-70 family RNA polymerase sigma factor [Myxococcales bacterium]
ERRGGALPFALAIARNVLVDDLRAKRPGVPLEETAAQLVDTRTPLADLLRGEEVQAARERYEKLSPEVRELLTLRYGDALSCAEIGELLGVSTAAVRHRLSRAVRSLRDRDDVAKEAMAHD